MALYQRLKRQILSRVQLVRVALVLAILAGGVAVWALVLRPLGPLVTTLWRAGRASLPTSVGRTNFLILGREGPSTSSGSARAGTDLTDTLILVSVHQSGDMVLLSIPRDLWVPSLRAKINTAYYYGEQRKPGAGGVVLAKAAVEEVTGQLVHYAVVIDFTGFEEVIDMLGGVDVGVERSFVDAKFPVPGRENDECGGDPTYSCRYEAVQFVAGSQHMNGATALKYVRSRQAEGGEGTDFARSKRQEKLLLAVRNRLLSRQVATNWRLWVQLYRQVASMMVIDITPDLYLALARLGVRAVGPPLRMVALAEPDWVYHPPISAAQDGQWVLLPVDDLAARVEDFLAKPVE